MAQRDRFAIVFAQDGAGVTISAGNFPPEYVSFGSMPAEARRQCFEFGFATYTRNAVAGAEKKGWSDAQCHGFMARKAKAIVAGQFRVSDGASDFFDLITVILAEKKLGAESRGAIEAAVLKKDTAWRDAARAKYRVQIAMARAERLAAEVAAMGDTGESDILADLD